MACTSCGASGISLLFKYKCVSQQQVWIVSKQWKEPTDTGEWRLGLRQHFKTAGFKWVFMTVLRPCLTPGPVHRVSFVKNLFKLPYPRIKVVVCVIQWRALLYLFLRETWYIFAAEIEIYFTNQRFKGGLRGMLKPWRVCFLHTGLFICKYYNI